MTRHSMITAVLVATLFLLPGIAAAGTHEHTKSSPSGSAYAYEGWAVSAAGDVDNDGHDDYIVGSYNDHTTDWSAGRARVFSGFDGKVLHTFLGAKKDDQFGHSVGTAGDVNLDGHDDVIVGAPGSDRGGTERGTVYVFSGKDGSTLYTVDGAKNYDLLGYTVDGGGDVNKDGYPDFMAGAPVDLGSMPGGGSAVVYSGKTGGILYTFTGPNQADRVGTAIAMAGDVNADGCIDVIVGALGDDTKADRAGKATVYSGKDGTALHTFYGDYKVDYFGMAVDGAGDVNADGYADLIVGSDRDGDDPSHYGRVYVLSGKDGSTLYSMSGDSDGLQVGSSVAGAGDLNADGYDDYLTGGIDTFNGGARTGGVRVYSGKDGALLYEYFGSASGDEFGVSATGAGDVNADGFADLIVGAWLEHEHDTDSGNFYLITSRPPSGTVTIDDGNVATGSRTVSLTLTGKAYDAELTDMRFRNEGEDWPEWQKVAVSATFTLTAGEGSRHVYAQFRDSDGWFSQLPVEDTIVLDETAPSGSVLIDQGAGSTAQTGVALSFTYQDATTEVTDLRIRNAGNAWEAWRPATPSTTFSLAGVEGPSTVEVEYRDRAGNVSEIVSDTILLDRTAPVGTLVIEGGMPFTGTLAVTLTLTGQDALSGVADMRLRNSGEPWENWRTFEGTVLRDLLPQDGPKTLQLELRDLVGNVSQTISATIVLDRTAPTTTGATINAARPYVLPLETLEFAVAAEDNDGGAGVESIRVSFDDGATFTDWLALPAGSAVTVPRPAATGDLRPWVYARDAVGNIGDPFEAHLYLVDPDPFSAGSGAKLNGTTGTDRDVDVVAVNLVAGDLLTAKVKTKSFVKKQTLVLETDLIAPDGTRIVSGRWPTTAKKTGIGAFPAPQTGRYLLVLHPAVGTPGGTYKLTVKVRPAKENRKGKGESAGDTITFAAPVGAVLKVSLKADGLAGGDITLEGPNGPVVIATKETGKGVKILPVVLDAGTGTYRIRSAGASTVSFSWSLKLPAKVKGDLVEG